MLINKSSTNLDEVTIINHFPKLQNYLDLRFPNADSIIGSLSDEPHVMRWKMYSQQVALHDVFPVLKKHLYCLRFPIEEGISQTEVHRAARLKGVLPPSTYKGLSLQSPNSLQLRIHKSVVGAVPVLITDNRTDFIFLVQAFAFKNEPVNVPDSMGACMIAGFNNWDRIHAYRKQWEVGHPEQCSELAWQFEFERILPQKSLYQDRFIILYKGFYSGVTPSGIGLLDEEWRQKSLQIRLEHECTHYFTKRVFGVMHSHLLDEMLADYAGIVAALGYYRADWFLRFMGMEAYPEYREGGRLQNYLGDISIQDYEFELLQMQLKVAVENLEHFDQQLGKSNRRLTEWIFVLMAICRFSLAELAAPNASDALLDAFQSLKEETNFNIM